MWVIQYQILNGIKYQIHLVFPSPQEDFTLIWTISLGINCSLFVAARYSTVLPTSPTYLLFTPQMMKNISKHRKIIILDWIKSFLYSCMRIHVCTIFFLLFLPYPHFLQLWLKCFPYLWFYLYSPYISLWKQCLPSLKSETSFLEIQHEQMLFELHFLSCWQNIFTPFFLPGGKEASCCVYKTILFRSSQSDRPRIYPETWSNNSFYQGNRSAADWFYLTPTESVPPLKID